MPTASILILTYNNLAYTRLCLESIYAYTNLADFELVVVDNASQDGTVDYLRTLAAAQPNIQLILNETNLGFARGCNQAAEYAVGENLVFLNNDTVVTPGWLPGLLQHLQDPQVGMVGPVTNRSANQTRILVDYDEQWPGSRAGGAAAGSLITEWLQDVETFSQQVRRAQRGKTCEVPLLPLLCAALRRQVFEQVGPLDERFGQGMFEDDDYALRLTDAGYRLLCVEDVFVHHWGSAGFSLEGYAHYWQLFQQNLEKFEAKWGVRWRPHHYRDELQDLQWRELWLEKRQMAFDLIRLRRQVEAFQASLPGKVFQAVYTRLPQDEPFKRVDRWLQRAGKPVLAALKSWLASWQRWRRSWRAGAAGKRLTVQLADILANQVQRKPIIVFTPSLRWETTLFQRPHQMASAFARLGCLVLFMEPPGSEHGSAALRQVQPGLYVLGGGALAGVGHLSDPPPYSRAMGKIPSPVVFTLAYNYPHLVYFDRPRIVYEMIDNLSVLEGDPERLQSQHLELLRCAEVVTATAGQLHEGLLPVRPDAILSPNAVDFSYIQQRLAETSAPPEALARFVQQGRRIVGYYGALAKWLDYALLADTAELRTQYQFVLVGPEYDGALQRSRLLDLPNVSWLGARPYTSLPAYLKYFDVAIIPFKQNAVTQAVSPIKLYEYLAAGKPVVATPTRECKGIAGILLAECAEEFAARLDEALELGAAPGYQAQAVRFAAENTWEARAERLLAALGQPKSNA